MHEQALLACPSRYRWLTCTLPPWNKRWRRHHSLPTYRRALAKGKYILNIRYCSHLRFLCPNCMKYQHICVWPSLRHRLKGRHLLDPSFHVKTNELKQEYPMSASSVLERPTSPWRRGLYRKSSHRAVETEAGGRGAETRSRPARDRKEKGGHFVHSQTLGCFEQMCLTYARREIPQSQHKSLTQTTNDAILLVLFRLVPSPPSD